MQQQKPNIVILNECFLTPAHMDALRAIGDVTVYENTTTEEQVIERLASTQIAIADVFIAPFTAKVFAALPCLKALCVNSVGIDSIDQVAAANESIAVYNMPKVFAESTAEFTIAMMLNMLRHIPRTLQHSKGPHFEADPGNIDHRAMFMGESLRGKTVGIIGLGATGQRVAELAKAFGMKVIATTRTAKNIGCVKEVSLDALCREADIISIHALLNDDTRGMINNTVLRQMKKGVYILNMARSHQIVYDDFIAALDDGTIAGCTLDYVHEAAAYQQLVGRSNVVITPHIAGYSTYAYNQIGGNIVQNVQNHLTAGDNNKQANG